MSDGGMAIFISFCAWSVKGCDFFSHLFSYTMHLFQKGSYDHVMFFSSVSFVFFFYVELWGQRLEWGQGKGSGVPYLFTREWKGRVSRHIDGAFFSFLSVLLGIWYWYWGLGILMMFLILMIVIAIMGPICGICGAGLMGVYVCSYCSYLSSLLRLSIEFSYTHYGAQRRVRG